MIPRFFKEACRCFSYPNDSCPFASHRCSFTVLVFVCIKSPRCSIVQFCFFFFLIHDPHSIASYVRNKITMAVYFVFSIIYVECHFISNFPPVNVIPSLKLRLLEVEGAADLLEVGGKVAM